jgi:hypothetical protein
VRHLAFVEAGTVGAVLCAFAWVGWRALRAARRLAHGAQKVGKDE